MYIGDKENEVRKAFCQFRNITIGHFYRIDNNADVYAVGYYCHDEKRFVYGIVTHRNGRFIEATSVYTPSF